jgi:hypothetical protein
LARATVPRDHEAEHHVVETVLNHYLGLHDAAAATAIARAHRDVGSVSAYFSVLAQAVRLRMVKWGRGAVAVPARAHAHTHRCAHAHTRSNVPAHWYNICRLHTAVTQKVLGMCVGKTVGRHVRGTL